MKALIQRVASAEVNIDNHLVASIKKGMLVLLGVEATDDESKAQKLASKLLKYRFFADDDDKMNLNVQQIGGEILVVSQFTLVADTKSGNRPSFSKGASPKHGNAMYEVFIQSIESQYQACQTGRFGADMQVSLVNDGPVTFLLEN